MRLQQSKLNFPEPNSKNKVEDTFEGQGTSVSKPVQVNDISQLPSMVQIPGMCSQEGADSIKKLAEKKRGYKEEGEKVTAEEKAPEPEKEQEPEASVNEEQDA
ncbi:hypothetical protein OIY81_3239 [Cryptosporidium canis]|nr:hypothetical protein OIY81_3239 [Cryptosporidium canis]